MKCRRFFGIKGSKGGEISVGRSEFGVEPCRTMSNHVEAT